MDNQVLADVLDTFKVMVVDHAPTKEYFIDRALEGFITDFNPDRDQVIVLRSRYAPLDIRTLFTPDERNNGNLDDLLAKQILHYIEVYGLGTPGLFNLEQTNGQAATINFVHGVTVDELEEMVQDVLYTNAPVKDASAFERIIRAYNLSFDINRVANNELRVMLFDVKSDTFTSGDDVVRWMVYAATKETLLIKSKEVIALVKSGWNDSWNKVLERHAIPLAQVFNRHKALILAVKNKQNRTIINRIARLSKSQHVPIHEGINKRFMALVRNDALVLDVLKDKQRISNRDLFKYLNLIEMKFAQLDRGSDAREVFVIRNGKMHVKEIGNRAWSWGDLLEVRVSILDELTNRLAHLNSKNILLDKNVQMGLPISHKQSFGNVPFGTRVITNGQKISAGIHWKDADGASDLDLSAVDMDGNRIGWGSYSGYTDKDIVYSGDVTSAYGNGSMEFMTSRSDFPRVYGLLVNIFNGLQGASATIIVGEDRDSKSRNWLDATVLREKDNLQSRSNLIGFVHEGTFVLYGGRVGGDRVSDGERDKALLTAGLANFWTVNKLLSYSGIAFDVDKEPGKMYDYDLSYSGISWDKIENLLT